MNHSILPPRPITPIVLEREDEITHTNERPYCSDLTCPCHDDPDLNAALAARVESGELSAAQALEVYWNL